MIRVLPIHLPAELDNAASDLASLLVRLRSELEQPYSVLHAHTIPVQQCLFSLRHAVQDMRRLAERLDS